MRTQRIGRARHLTQPHVGEPVTPITVTDQSRIARKAKPGVIEQGIGRQLIEACLGRGSSAHQAVLGWGDRGDEPQVGQPDQAIGEIQL